MVEALHRAIKHKGSRKKLCGELGVTGDRMKGWLNRGINVPLEYALEIERVTKGAVKWYEVASHLAHFAKRWKDFSLPHCATTISATYVALSQIRHTDHLSVATPTLYALSEDIQQNGLRYPICIDSHNNLIFGQKRLQAYVLLHQKAILAWRLSLEDLLAGNYNQETLSLTFRLSERIAISLAVEQRLGRRQGQRTDRLLRQNFDEVIGRTDAFLVDLLQFGNRQTYQQAKKTCQRGCPELIEAMDQGLLSISAAAILTKLSFEEQKQVLAQPKKAIMEHVKFLKKQQAIDSVESKALGEEAKAKEAVDEVA